MSKLIYEAYPELLQEWDFNLNNEDPYSVTCGSNSIIWWKCKQGHQWQAIVYNRAKPNKTNCPYCTGNIVSNSNSLQDNAPLLSSEFSLNYNHPLTPNEIHVNSNKKYWWKCNRGEDHIWQARPNDRMKKPGCPFCSGRRASKDNNLCVHYPELIKQWDYENNDVQPTDLTKSSSRRVWWKCNKAEDHIWLASPNQRSTRQSNCPFCSGRKVCTSNCLSTTHPHLLNEWHFEKNTIKPNEVTYSTHKKVWWKCQHGHEWQAIIYSRSVGKGCPECNISHGEEKVKEVLERLNIDFKREYRLEGIKLSRFDFALFMGSKIKLIEYHGIQHYEPVSWSKDQNAQRNLKVNQQRDEKKRRFVSQHNIPLLEIPHWKFNEIESLVEDFAFYSSF